MNVKPNRKIRSPACSSRNAFSPSISSSISSLSAYCRLVPNIEKPNIPAPRAARFLITAELSRISMGTRFVPSHSLTIFVRHLVCKADVFRSKKILLTCCPVVPEEVMVFTTSSAAHERSSNSLNSRTGKNGKNS